MTGLGEYLNDPTEKSMNSNSPMRDDAGCDSKSAKSDPQSLPPEMPESANWPDAIYMDVWGKITVYHVLPGEGVRPSKFNILVGGKKLVARETEKLQARVAELESALKKGKAWIDGVSADGIRLANEKHALQDALRQISVSVGSREYIQNLAAQALAAKEPQA